MGRGLLILCDCHIKEGEKVLLLGGTKKERVFWPCCACGSCKGGKGIEGGPSLGVVVGGARWGLCVKTFKERSSGPGECTQRRLDRIEGRGIKPVSIQEQKKKQQLDD